VTSVAGQLRPSGRQAAADLTGGSGRDLQSPQDGPCAFLPREPRIWHGRYARIPGYQPALHVRWADGTWWPLVVWPEDGEIASCPMTQRGPAADLARAVNRGKQLLGAPPGGSFLINEFAQVLVPSVGRDGRIALVGEWQGPLECADMLHGGAFDLAPRRPPPRGDLWRLPYLGIPYHLSARSEIYFWDEGTSGSSKLRPPAQDTALIDQLRGLRPSGAVRFIACYGGLVLTKVPAGPRRDSWEARYVGQLDYTRWFAKET
jgi:hypothetical protein